MKHLSQLNDTIRQQVPNFVKAGETITVTIGRNVGADPLPADAWQAFHDQVVEALTPLVRPSFTFTYRGVGEWEGVAEDSACILFGATQYTTERAHVDRILSEIAGTYDQDAIGWSAGPAFLATR